MITTYTANTTGTGNKARHLFTLQSLGIRVPRFCVITHGELQDLLQSQSLSYTEGDIQKAAIPDSWVEQIRTYFTDCNSFAVRSSTSAEDSQDQSYAGQFSTLLNVNHDGLSQAIKEVWLSPHKQHIKAYHGSGQASIPIAIIIQECVEAEVSGVVFTANPVTGDTGACIVNSVYGLGEGLVSGILDADMFEIGDNDTVKEVLADKDEKFVYKPGGGLGKVAVDPSITGIASIGEGQLLALRDTAKRIEAHFGAPQDIEFCIKRGQVYWLQARPITTLNTPSDYLVWDNSNIIESYPGITLPLTFSFISPVYSAVYRQLSAVLGIEEKLIAHNSFVYDNMLGLLRGRVYYNLYSWYKILSLLPGYSLNAGFMEKMMGVSEKFELKDYQKPSKLTEKIRVLKLIFSLLGNARRLPRMRERFTDRFNELMADHNALNISTADANTCMHAYLKLESTLSREWKAPLVNDFFAMIYYGLFEKFMTKNGAAFAQGQNNYLVGTGKVITVEPALLQKEISLLIQHDQELSQLFKSSNEDTILDWFRVNPGHQVTRLFNEYINKWGDRCFAELKLETVTYRQDPKSFIRILQNTFGHASEHERVHKTGQDKPQLGLFKKSIFHFLRSRAVDTVTARENLRFERTRAFAAVRSIFMRLGGIFEKEGILAHRRDIFYLTKKEIFNYIKGTSVQLELKKLVALRKEEYAGYLNEPPQSPRIRTTGIVYRQPIGPEIIAGEGSMKGIPCCPGVVNAEVKVIHSPDDIAGLEGKIMVTTSTDPGWVSVFPLVEGIIVQRGSVLSHAAIVSREMNIPCIVGVKNITSLLKTGDRIEMNGQTGEIRII